MTPDLLDAFTRIAHAATGVAAARCRDALWQALVAFEHEGDATVRSSSAADGRHVGAPTCCTSARALLGDRVRRSLRRLARDAGSRSTFARTLHLVDVQLVIYRALASAGLVADIDAANHDVEMVPTPGRSSQSVGTVFWVTGLSGAGKTTFAAALRRALQATGRHVSSLDGDDLRAPIALPATARLSDHYAPDARRRLAVRYAELARLAAVAGDDVICATVSAFHDVRADNRCRIERYVEIWVDTPLDTLRARDPVGLYARAHRGEVINVVGVDLPFEAPIAPDHIVRNVGTRRDLRQAAADVVVAWRARYPQLG